jgi:hypothetical protein
MNLNKMMDQGIAQIMTTAGRFYLNNSKGRAFLMGVLPELAKAAGKRRPARTAISDCQYRLPM